MSLYTLLNTQRISYNGVTHEYSLLPWKPNKDSLVFAMQRFFSIANRKSEVSGDVGMYHLNYIDYYVEAHDNIRIIVLKRNKEATVKSWLKWIGPKGHRWLDHKGKDPRFTYSRFDEFHPKYGIEDREEACKKYYDDYYTKALALVDKYSDIMRMYRMGDVLNNLEAQAKMLEFVGIPKEEQKLRETHLNTS